MKQTALTLSLILSIFSTALFAKNSFLVAPGLVEFDLSKPITQSFIITNDGDESIRLSIKPIYFDIDDHTLALGKHLDDTTAELENITGSIRVSPKRLSLKPGQRRDIRVSIRPKKELTDGDYRSHLLVQMLETAQVIKPEGDISDEGVGMNINVKMETAVAIYGRKGEGEPKISFLCGRDNESGNFMFKVVNDTIWRFDGPIQIQDQGSNTLFDSRIVSLRGSENIWVLEQPYASNNYEISYALSKKPDDVITDTCRAI